MPTPSAKPPRQWLGNYRILMWRNVLDPCHHQCFNGSVRNAFTRWNHYFTHSWLTKSNVQQKHCWITFNYYGGENEYRSGDPMQLDSYHFSWYHGLAVHRLCRSEPFATVASSVDMTPFPIRNQFTIGCQTLGKQVQLWRQHVLADL